jgi:hypothetical protein
MIRREKQQLTRIPLGSEQVTNFVVNAQRLGDSQRDGKYSIIAPDVCIAGVRCRDGDSADIILLRHMTQVMLRLPLDYVIVGGLDLRQTPIKGEVNSRYDLLHDLLQIRKRFEGVRSALQIDREAGVTVSLGGKGVG